MVPDPHLMESLRAVGYTLTTAVADVIDNSITAGSTSVEIRVGSEPEDYLAIIDNGTGMTAEQAQHAMRLAGTSSASSRSSTDLGRFGLGLKTASLSQCRRLTVVSRRHGVLCGYEWDLDHLQRTQSWSLIELDEKECVGLPGFELLDDHDSGTLVLWRNLDILQSTHGDFGTGLNRALVELRDHLALVFHRFLAGEHGNPLQIALNARPVEGADPLMPTHKATQVGPPEQITVDGGSVVLQAFTLPHLNKLTQKQRQLAQVSGSLRDSQGFYIYREKRLVIWGTWFRIMPKQELGKLARVRVDIPNTLDHLWSLDIKKAQAAPPTIIRERLKSVSEKMIAPSRRVAEYRGRITSTGAVIPAWNVVDQDGAFRYEINRKHPLVSAMADAAGPSGFKSFQALLGLLERSFPVDHAYNLLGQDFTYAPSSLANADLVIEATKIWKCVSLLGSTPDEFVASFAVSDLFSSVADPESLLRKVARNEL
jgi:hypothetical protein